MKKDIGDWINYIGDEFDKDYFKELEVKIDNLYKTKTIYPSEDNIFKALKLTSYKDTYVCILGQDPYHEEGQAMGLSFSVPNSCKNPPSLVNIFKELNRSLGINNTNGDLTKWAKQGVLLLNTCLTVESGKANSHKDFGWERFTDRIIFELNKKDKPVIFVLWGNNSQEKEKIITNKIHHILKSSHPSPLSCYRGFNGCDHFRIINELLQKDYGILIDWKN